MTSAKHYLVHGIACAAILWSALLVSAAPALAAPALEPVPEPVHLRFLQLVAGEPAADEPALDWLAAHWQDDYVPLALEALRFIRRVSTYQSLYGLLEKNTRHPELPRDWQAWSRWQWTERPAPPPHYADFKATLYSLLDPRFKGYFASGRETLLRLDEVVWGGVLQDGIPPLREPRMIAAREAKYLADRNIVFGVEVNGDLRAYPKRILAWHEMFVDRVGGVDVAGVYCTLCGTVILYETRVNDTLHRMGTSGFLYRSNKLMYDKETQSLWSTLEGNPVIGPLVGKGIVLKSRTVVTTTWGEWRRRHPQTKVLSPDTGHSRDYSEGAAYREYFATDELMFPVPRLDSRLANKQEVLLPRFGRVGEKPLAISSDYLKKNPLFHGRYGGQDYVVLTDKSGAHRIYALAAGMRIASWDGDRLAIDAGGRQWRLSEAALQANNGARLERLPSHNAFWFGWQAAFPDTQLIAGEGGEK